MSQDLYHGEENDLGQAVYYHSNYENVPPWIGLPRHVEQQKGTLLPTLTAYRRMSDFVGAQPLWRESASLMQELCNRNCDPLVTRVASVSDCEQYEAAASLRGHPVICCLNYV